MYEYRVKNVLKVVDDVNLNNAMIDQVYAWPYMNDTKIKDFDLLLKRIR